MSRIIVSYDHKKFAESKNFKTERVELDIDGAITESIIAKHIASKTSHTYIDVKDWIFDVHEDIT